MNSLTQSSYMEIYDKFQSLFENEIRKIKKLTLVCDDESGQHGAFINSFKLGFDIDVEVNLCSWHFNRNLMTHLSNLGFAHLYKTNVDSYDGSWKVQYTMIKYLWLLPPTAMLVAVKYVESKSDPKMVDFFKYLSTRLAKNDFCNKLSWLALLLDDDGINLDATSSRCESLHSR